MMYSPIAYAAPALFALLTKDLRSEVRSEAASPQSGGGGGVEPELAATLELLTPPPAAEEAAFEATRKENGWPKDKRLRVALFHYV